MIDTKFLFYLSILSLLFFQCEYDDDLAVVYDDCPESIYLGDFFLDQITIDNPYYQNENARLIFSDSLGNEFEGKLDIQETVHELNSLMQIDCESDPDSAYWKYTYLADKRKIVLEFEELDFGLLFSNYIDAYPLDEMELETSVVSTNHLQISLNPGLNEFPSGQISVEVKDLYDPKSDLRSGIFFHEKLELHGIILDNVFCFKLDAIASQKDFEIYYTIDKGLVGFRNLTNPNSFKFERAE